MSYGALNAVDVRVLEAVLARYCDKPLTFLEVGIHVGDTARGVWHYCRDHGIALTYYGVDPVKPQICPPFPGAHFVYGDSAEVFHWIPSVDIAFIDGCHCRNHVILDTINYGERVKPHGWMLFHDCSPEIQQTMKDPHGAAIPQFYNSVLEAHQKMRFPFPEWVLADSQYEHGHQYGGINAYRRCE